MNRGIYKKAPDIVRVRKTKSPELWWLPWMVKVRIGRTWYHADEADNWHQAMAIARQIVKARRDAELAAIINQEDSPAAQIWRSHGGAITEGNNNV